jgi:hypothetical protein
MDPKCRSSFCVVLCHSIVRIASLLVPSGQRHDWTSEWFAEIWHRWQFLRENNEWTVQEQLRLLQSCLGAFQDAAWHLGSEESFRTRLQELARSPWTCLGALSTILVIFSLFTGLPATRQLFGPLSRADSDKLIILWERPFGGKEHRLPSDIIPDWRKFTHALESISAFNMSASPVRTSGRESRRLSVVTADPFLLQVFGIPVSRAARYPLVVIDDAAWSLLFNRDPHVIGSVVAIGTQSYPVSAVLPSGFSFLSRQASVFLIEPFMDDMRAMAVARIKHVADVNQVERERAKITSDEEYYFRTSTLQITPLNTLLLTPLHLFGVAVLVCTLLAAMLCRIRPRHLRLALKRGKRQATIRRCSFFVGKMCLALLLVFTAGLEWMRPRSSVLMTWTDSGSGPLLIWFYILGCMGAFFWAIADQRARCRVCLRLLCFPVRIGCPGCLLLEWAGTELLCSEGHGVLHVPHLATSWDEESDRWIALDDSWRELFASRTA